MQLENYKEIEMKYKMRKLQKPYCPNCEEFIRGNGSMMLPYTCDCGIWKFDEDKFRHILIIKDE